MKNFLILLVAFTSFSAGADTLTCSTINQFSDQGTILEGDLGIEIKTTASCMGKNDSFLVTIHGGGVGAYFAAADGFVIYCPFQGNIEGEYYGLSAKAAILFGLGAGAYASGDGACILGRASFLTAGASVEGSKLSIARK